jgi:methyltransferase (TIGR00027 family)
VKSGRASKTAEQNALFRALEARRPQGDRVVDDPLAEAFLSWRYKLVAAPARWRVWRHAVISIIDQRWSGVRPTVIARTRLIDELVAEVAPAAPQVVILGAGFDTRAWRLDALGATTVFEVDHPDTQRRKHELLRRHDTAGAADVRFIPTDFNLGRLATAMADAGFDRSLPTMFLWEGTTNYLSAEAVDSTMRWCAQAAAGSHLIFTYINEDVLADPGRYVGADRVFSTLRRVDEPMTFGLAPDAMGAYLADRGLSLVSDAGAASFRRRAYGAASDTIEGHEFYRVAHARIGPPPVAPERGEAQHHPRATPAQQHRQELLDG